MNAHPTESKPFSPVVVDSAALALSNVYAGYGRVPVLRDVSLTVPKGTVAALLGPNGAGKTTLLKTVGGLITPASGHILLEGVNVVDHPAHKRVRNGLCLIPEGRGVFPELTVRENLLLQIPPWEKSKSIERVFDIFPAIHGRLGTTVAQLSGGQQQMVALARCVLSNASVILCDEVSMGLAPKIVDEIFEALVKLTHAGITLLLVEQYVSKALAIADEVFMINRGEIIFAGAPNDLDEQSVIDGYLSAT